MYKFDLIQLIGQKSCTLASRLTEMLAAEPACSHSEVWNMGLLVTVTTAVVLVALVVAERRRARREDGGW
jgi:hypothetical protein